jgi:hypothetical protein
VVEVSQGYGAITNSYYLSVMGIDCTVRAYFEIPDGSIDVANGEITLLGDVGTLRSVVRRYDLSGNIIGEQALGRANAYSVMARKDAVYVVTCRSNIRYVVRAA